jgi:hypothetical protein
MRAVEVDGVEFSICEKEVDVNLWFKFLWDDSRSGRSRLPDPPFTVGCFMGGAPVHA